MIDKNKKRKSLILRDTMYAEKTYILKEFGKVLNITIFMAK